MVHSSEGRQASGGDTWSHSQSPPAHIQEAPSSSARERGPGRGPQSAVGSDLNYWSCSLLSSPPPTPLTIRLTSDPLMETVTEKESENAAATVTCKGGMTAHWILSDRFSLISVTYRIKAGTILNLLKNVMK